MVIKLMHYTYWFLIFNIGTFGLLGLPTALHKIGIPFLGFALFFMTMARDGSNVKFPFFGWVGSFLVVIIASKMINGSAMFSMLSFIFYTLLPYFYLIVIINEKDPKLINAVTKCIIILILIQIPASLIKYGIMGQSEKGAIGTLSVGLGSFSTVFPVLIIAFLMSFYLFTDKVKYIILVMFFVLFGIIGGKRAITFIIPLELLLSYFLFLKYFIKKRDLKKIRNLLYIVVFGAIAFYVMVRTNPSLNKENEIGGSFDIEFLMNYSESYTSSDGKGKKEMRRKDGLIYFLTYNINSKFEHMLFGDGAGILIMSNFDKNSGDMESLYGVRYGGRMGMIWLILQVGMLGLFIYIGFLLRMIYVMITKLPIKNNYLLMGFAVASFFMLIDTLIYSNTFIAFEVVKSIYFYIIALLLLQMKLLKSNKKVRLLYVNTTI